MEEKPFSAESQPLNEIKSIDYVIRRKRIYKGKFAPQGSLFIVVTVKSDKMKYEGHKSIEGGRSVESEFNVAKRLRQMIKDKYKV